MTILSLLAKLAMVLAWGVLIVGSLAAIFIKLFERQMPVRYAIILGWRSFFLSTFFGFVLYTLAEPFKPSDGADTAMTILWLVSSAVVMTWQSQKYGIAKRGWIGLGAKVMFATTAFACLSTIVTLIVLYPSA
ncbi:MAG: hypothetical protein K2X60_09825 [Xanthobacteraceae bacterium]|nr:hypothetical protein [Xanthobacteraceae bacterium]